MYEVIAEHDIINRKVLLKRCIIVWFLGIRYCLMATKRIYYARYAMDMISLVKKKCSILVYADDAFVDPC